MDEGIGSGEWESDPEGGAHTTGTDEEEEDVLDMHLKVATLIPGKPYRGALLFREGCARRRAAGTGGGTGAGAARRQRSMEAARDGGASESESESEGAHRCGVEAGVVLKTLFVGHDSKQVLVLGRLQRMHLKCTSASCYEKKGRSHEFPFKLMIPSTYPPSLRGAFGRVCHVLEGYAGELKTNEREVNLEATVPPERIKRASIPMEIRESKSKFGEGKLTLIVTTQKSHFAQGEVVNLLLHVSNTSSRQTDHVSVRLISKLVHGSEQHESVESEAKIPFACPSKGSSTQPIKFSIPTVAKAVLCSFNTTFLRTSFILEVKVNLGWGLKAVAVLEDVVVCPANTGRNKRKAKGSTIQHNMAQLPLAASSRWRMSEMDDIRSRKTPKKRPDGVKGLDLQEFLKSPRAKGRRATLAASEGIPEPKPNSARYSPFESSDALVRIAKRYRPKAKEKEPEIKFGAPVSQPKPREESSFRAIEMLHAHIQELERENELLKKQLAQEEQKIDRRMQRLKSQFRMELGVEDKAVDQWLEVHEQLAGVGGSSACVHSVSIHGLECAMKSVKSEFDEDYEAIEKEILVFESLPRHPNLVQMLYWMHHDGTTRVFMPRYAGTLAEVIADQRKVLPPHLAEGERIRSRGDTFKDNPFHKQMARATNVRSRMKVQYDMVPLKPAFIRACMLDIMNGVHTMHKKRFVHRDIKSENVFITRSQEGVLKCLIGDFDTAVRIGKGEKLNTIFGTTGYIAPEVLRNDPYDNRADYYSVGMVLYELLALSSPFFGEAAFEVSNKVIAGERPQLPPFITEDPTYSGLVDLYLRLTEPDPAYRPLPAQVFAALWESQDSKAAPTSPR
eukprot:TRINITY_DN3999_c0_g1_i1.p1 TRINITY_DN3999_c0_g1~~TRINITY_DN3999_c0_g1_i1.p1  ORF type:complete len:882 (-),score=312.26 TRINITY_DN3999_c0_g1_i1:363-2900(-)